MFQLYLNLIQSFPYVENMQDIHGENILGKTYFEVQDGIWKSFVYSLYPGFRMATWKNNQVWYEYRI